MPVYRYSPSKGRYSPLKVISPSSFDIDDINIVYSTTLSSTTTTTTTTRMRHLKVAHLPKFTDKTLMLIAERCKDTLLRSLDISHCFEISGKAFKQVSQLNRFGNPLCIPLLLLLLLLSNLRSSSSYSYCCEWYGMGMITRYVYNVEVGWWI